MFTVVHLNKHKYHYRNAEMLMIKCIQHRTQPFKFHFSYAASFHYIIICANLLQFPFSVQEVARISFRTYFVYVTFINEALGYITGQK